MLKFNFFHETATKTRCVFRKGRVIEYGIKSLTDVQTVWIDFINIVNVSIKGV